MTNVTLFAQIIQTLDRFSFSKLVQAHGTDKHHKGIHSWTHMVRMLFCQFSKLNSLRDVCNGLQSASGNLNHLGGGAGTLQVVVVLSKQTPSLEGLSSLLLQDVG